MTDLTAAQILAIPKESPHLLFSGHDDERRRQMRAYAKQWQPRKDGDDSSVIGHINMLHDLVDKQIKDGTWQGNGVAHFITKQGAGMSFSYLRRRPFELGTMFTNGAMIGYHIEGNGDLVNRASLMFKHFKYADTKMKNEVDRYLPHLASDTTLDDGRFITLQKDSDLVLLRDLMEHLGSIDPKHAAWMISHIYSISCYLRYAGIVHGAISPDTFYVYPKDHTGALLGGWWYSARKSDQWMALPNYSMDVIPRSRLKERCPTSLLDLECIKKMGREILGDIGGSRLISRKDVPRPMAQFLRMPSSGDALQDYQSWANVLKDSYGVRRFVKLEVKASDIYA